MPGQTIVRYEEGAGQAERTAVRRNEGVVKEASLDLINADMVKVEGVAVGYAVPDRVVHTTEYGGGER